MNLKKIEKVLTSKSVWTGPSSYEKRIYRAAVSQSLRNNAVTEGHDLKSGRKATGNTQINYYWIPGQYKVEQTYSHSMDRHKHRMFCVV